MVFIVWIIMFWPIKCSFTCNICTKISRDKGSFQYETIYHYIPFNYSKQILILLHKLMLNDLQKKMFIIFWNSTLPGLSKYSFIVQLSVIKHINPSTVTMMTSRISMLTMNMLDSLVHCDKAVNVEVIFILFNGFIWTNYKLLMT